jgi:hypothetical protein
MVIGKFVTKRLKMRPFALLFVCPPVSLYNSMTVEFVFKVFGMANKTEIC